MRRISTSPGRTVAHKGVNARFFVVQCGAAGLAMVATADWDRNHEYSVKLHCEANFIRLVYKPVDEENMIMTDVLYPQALTTNP